MFIALVYSSFSIGTINAQPQTVSAVQYKSIDQHISLSHVSCDAFVDIWKLESNKMWDTDSVTNPNFLIAPWG